MKWGMLAVVVSAVGCTSPYTTTGFHFEVGRPSAAVGTAVVDRGARDVNIAPIMSGAPVMMRTRRPAAGAEVGFEGYERLQMPSYETGTGCNLADVCRRLDALEKRLRLAISNGAE